MEPKQNKTQVRGWIFLFLWAVLIVAGIVEKRIYFNPDLMVFFHLPAAVFLVLAGYELSRKVREEYRETLLKHRNKPTD
jgi:hypothetical protein